MSDALDAALERIAEAAANRREIPVLEATVERSRKQIEELATTVAAVEASIPDALGAALRDGMRDEVLPVARQLAEIRGLFNQALRRLERLEGEVAADRHARVDDLELLVALVSSAWRSLDARLVHLERRQDEAATRIIAAIEDLPLFDSPAEPSGQFAAA
jgi:hypothetical protein